MTDQPDESVEPDAIPAGDTAEEVVGPDDTEAADGDAEPDDDSGDLTPTDS